MQQRSHFLLLSDCSDPYASSSLRRARLQVAAMAWLRFLVSRERHSKAESPAFLGLVAVASAAVATDSGGGDSVLVVPFPLLHSIVGGFLRERSLARSQNRDADPVFVEMSQWEAPRVSFCWCDRWWCCKLVGTVGVLKWWFVLLVVLCFYLWRPKPKAMCVMHIL